MELDIYQVDAFTTQVFSGNPAAVVPLDEWLSGAQMQSIAAENNLSETAFFVKEREGFALRWFTPTTEVALCGHATLATAWVIMNECKHPTRKIRFYTRSGELNIECAQQKYIMDFPCIMPVQCQPPKLLLEALDIQQAEVYEAEDLFVILNDQQQVIDMDPNLALLSQLATRGVAITARGEDVDFVSRWFGPQTGVNEDPVTGSAHTSLAPLWAKKLNKTALSAKQVSARGGELECECVGGRVYIQGQAVKYMQGKIFI